MNRTEAHVARDVADLLARSGWDLFFEVDFPGGRRFRADIVADKGDLMVVEVQRRLDSRLLWEAERWRFFADFVSVAFDGGMMTKRCQHLIGVAAAAGIGVLHAGHGIVVDPERLPGSGTARLRKNLKAANRVLVPGAAGGHRATPLSETITNLIDEVARVPGRSLDEVLPLIHHHWYSDAAASRELSRLLALGKIRRITSRRLGTALLLYPR